MKELLEIKDTIQRSAHGIWSGSGRQGTVAAGTGFGKSRIAVLEVERLVAEGEVDSPDDVLLVTPTEKLRDVNWPNEFIDWDCEHLLQYVKRICFASLKNEINQHYKFVILDEIHRLTELSARGFEETGEEALVSFSANNLCDAILGLTATEPDPKRDPEKAHIINQVAPVVFRYTLDQGIEDGMIADYEIRVIEMNLDTVTKNIDAGTKAKPFKTTEAKQYEYLEKKAKQWRILENQTKVPKDAAKFNKPAKFNKLAMFATMARNRFIYNLPSKTALAARCIKHATAGGKRTLVFCGSIEQCNTLLGEDTYHSKVSSAAYNRFNAKEIHKLGVVNAANEGINFVDLDQAIIIQIDSNERNLVQRIGRALRLRLGHKAIIYIIVVKDTADERWLEKSLAGFDQSKIFYFSSKSIPL